KEDKQNTNAPPPPLLKSIEGILPNSSIRMRANAASFASSAPGMTTVALTVGVRQILATNGAAPQSDNVQFRVGAFTPEGKERGVVAATRALDAAAFGDGKAADVRDDVPTARLAPGEYLLRFETGAGKAVTKRDVRFSIR